MIFKKSEHMIFSGNFEQPELCEYTVFFVGERQVSVLIADTELKAGTFANNMRSIDLIINRIFEKELMGVRSDFISVFYRYCDGTYCQISFSNADDSDPIVTIPVGLKRVRTTKEIFVDTVELEQMLELN